MSHANTASYTQTTDSTTATVGALRVGDCVSARSLQSLDGSVRLPADQGLTHVQLRRFAGCPVCNLHLRSVIQRREVIAAAGITELVVFHSSPQELARYQPELPLTVIPDPDRELYRFFGVERSLRAVLDPRLARQVPHILAGVIRGLFHGQRPPRLLPHGGQLGLPADILLDADGRVLAIKYGQHAYDQWSVDELLTHAGPTAASIAPGSNDIGQAAR